MTPQERLARYIAETTDYDPEEAARILRSDLSKREKRESERFHANVKREYHALLRSEARKAGLIP